MEIVELVENCDLVRTGYEDNGHDCWGNLEYSSYKYVYIEGRPQKCFDGWLVIHDGKQVKELTLPSIYEHRLQLQKLEKLQQELFEETGFRTVAEHKAYLKGKEDGSIQ